MTKNVIEGMSILLKYYDNKEGYHTGTIDKNIICMFTTDSPVSEEDKQKLAELGWEENDCDGWEINV